jgi:hypothetical protein
MARTDRVGTMADAGRSFRGPILIGLVLATVIGVIG